MRSPVAELVKRRYSCRTYQERPLSPTDRDTLSEFLDSLHEIDLGERGRAPFGARTTFALVAATDTDRRALKGLGTYGTIKGATGFIVGAVRPGPGDMEDYGYCLEQAVLAATDLGLGTCWLGGTFTKSAFARKIAATPREVVPAVVAVGYPADENKNHWIRLRAGSDRRLPYGQLFFDGRPGHPFDPDQADGYKPVLESVRWAPSASNKQPWRLVRSEASWHFYLDRTKGYGVGSITFSLMRMADLQRVDMGIAMCHFELVARERGLPGRWVVDPSAVAPPSTTILPTDLSRFEYTVSWVPEAG